MGKKVIKMKKMKVVKVILTINAIAIALRRIIFETLIKLMFKLNP